jgi:hypothetical protein
MAATKPNNSMDITDIQRRMAQIRHDMHQEVQIAVKGAQSLTDWRGVVKNHPWLSLSLASVLGYLIVRKRSAKTPTIVAVATPGPGLLAATAPREQPGKAPRTTSSPLGTIFSLLAPIVVRAGQNYALSYLEGWLAQHPLPPDGNGTRDRAASTEREAKGWVPSPRIREFR